MGLLDAITGIFTTKAKNAAYADAANKQNQYTDALTGARQNVLGMVNPSQLLSPTTTTTGSTFGTTGQNVRSAQSGMSSSMPVFTPEGMQAYRAMLDAAGTMPTALSPAQKAMQLNAARASGDAGRTAAANALAAHGGGAPGMTGALAQDQAIQTANALNNTIAGFDTTNAQLAAAKAGVEGQAAGLGRGQQQAYSNVGQTSGTTTSEGGTTSQRVGSALEGIPTLLQLLSPAGPQVSTKTGQNSLLAGLQGLFGGKNLDAGDFFGQGSDPVGSLMGLFGL